MAAMQVELEARKTCWSCRRTIQLCLCSRVLPFRWDAKIVVLIHPKEYRQTVGTARIVKLSMIDSDFWAGHGSDFESHTGLHALLDDPQLFPVILFPGPKSTNLNRASNEELSRWIPTGKKLAIIVIDGSWSLARKMLSSSKTLRELPRVSFDVSRPSNYGFRRQPRPYCLSTVEAVHLLMEILSNRGLYPLPENHAHDRMLETFDWLVQEQIRFNK